MFVPPHFQTQNLGLGIEPTDICDVTLAWLASRCWARQMCPPPHFVTFLRRCRGHTEAHSYRARTHRHTHTIHAHTEAHSHNTLTYRGTLTQAIRHKTYIHTYIMTYIYIYTHTYIHIHIHTYIHTYTPTYANAYMHIHCKYVQMQAHRNSCILSYIETNKQTNKQPDVYPHIRPVATGGGEGG